MKLTEDLKPEVVSIGSDITEYKSTIAEENIPLVLSLVSKGIYSSPVSSIIRELVSNCQDANTELGEKKPILVNINYDYENENYYIEFVDKGIGMSEERIQSVYTSFFSSTKRNSNSLIGAFGLGSKSPLSYTDLFYITTIYDNIKYDYIYFKDGDDFTLSLMSKNKVLEKSGTTIKIDIKKGDESNFLSAVKQQLSYFDDVYVNTNYREYDNDFLIYEGKYFKFKSSDRPYNQMHICLGQVSYPIDWKVLEVEPIDIPIAVKFNIGEIHPTLERENIKYTDESKQVIKDKIELALDELREYFKDQTFELNDLKEYYNKREETPYLYFNKELGHGIKAYRKDFGKNSYMFKPLEGFELPNDPANLLFMYDTCSLDNGKTSEISSYEFARAWKRGVKIIIKQEKGFNAAYSSYFRGYYIVLIPKKFKYRDAISYLNIKSYKYSYSYRASGSSYYENLAVKNQVSPFLLGTAKTILKVATEVKNYFNSISEKYEDVPLDYVEEYRAKKKAEYLENKQIEKERVVFTNKHGSYEDISLKKLLSYRYILYCLKDEKFDVNLYEEILERSNYKRKDFIFISVSKTQYQKIKKHKMIHMSKFLKNPNLNNTLYKIKLANYIKYKVSSGIVVYPPANISEYHYSLYRQLVTFYLKYSLDLGKTKVNTHKRKHNCCWKITKIFKEYLETRDKFEIFEHIDNNMPEKFLKQIVKTIKLTKLNSNLYK